MKRPPILSLIHMSKRKQEDKKESEEVAMRSHASHMTRPSMTETDQVMSRDEYSFVMTTAFLIRRLV
jgi:hypothetical protein